MWTSADVVDLDSEDIKCWNQETRGWILDPRLAGSNEIADLFVAQSDEWIDFGRTPCRDVAREEGCEREQ